MFKIILLLVLGLAMFTACGGDDNGGELSALRIALLIEDGSPASGEVFEDFRVGLEEYIGIPVQVVRDATHLVGIEAMRAGYLDIMWGSPFVYLLATQTMEVERLAITSSPTAINKAVFVTHRDDVATLDDLRGMTFAFVNSGSASGFLYPMYYLINRYGMSRDEIMTPGALFGEVTFSGSNNASISGVANRDFDGAAVGYLQLNTAIRNGLIPSDALRIIGESERIPFPGYIARSCLPREVIDAVQRFILAYDNDEYFNVRFNDPVVRFVRPDPEGVAYLRSMVEVLDVDLAEQS